MHIYKFKNMLREIGLFAVRNVTVRKNGQTFKPCPNKYMLIFQYKTTLRELPSPSLPMYGFNFTPIPRIIQASRDNEFLIGTHHKMKSSNFILLTIIDDMFT